MDFKVEYDNDKSPAKIHYYRNADGYYWSDKTWIFGKAQWSYYNHAASGSEALLASLNWNTSKKAFTNVSGLSLSTTSTFTYRYLDCDPQNLPDYEPIVTTDVDDRGVETVDVKSAVHFRVVDQGDGGQNQEYHLSKLTLYPKDTGYYCYSVGDGEPTNWRKINDLTSPIIIGMSGTSSFGIFYLSSSPTYSEETDWPDWLDPNPIGDNPSDLVLSEKIYFRVNSNGLYRVSSGTDDDTPQSHMWTQEEPYGWKQKTSGNDLQDIMEAKTVEDAMYIYKIDSLPTQFDYNRSYTVDDSASSSSLPAWLIAENDPTITTDQVPDVIKYKANSNGYFKLDSNESWVYYESGSELLSIGGKDDCIIYYTEELPEYTEDNFQNHDMFNLFDIEVVQSPNPGNPKEINFKVASVGYYRANNGMSWKYLTEGETLLTSKIGDMVYLYHLKAPENPDLDSISISIKPRWWKL